MPTYRPDVNALFGKYLPREGIYCHIVGKAQKNKQDAVGHFDSQTLAPQSGNRIADEISYLKYSTSALIAATKNKFDVIQVRDMVTIGVMAELIAKIKGIPFVYWCSFLMSEDRVQRAKNDGAWRNSLRATMVWVKGQVELLLLYHFLLPNADHVFVQSRQMLEYMARRGIRTDRMTFVPMGVDLEELPSSAAPEITTHTLHDTPTIAYIGTIDNGRQPKKLIDILCEVKKRVAKVRMLIIGADDQSNSAEHLVQYAKERCVERSLHITGWMPQKECWSLASTANIAISFFPRTPILDTNSPTKLVEYLALGLPVVCNDNPDQAELLRDCEAGWVTSSDTAEMAKAICEALNDLPKSSARGANGRAIVRAHRSYAILAKKVANAYRTKLPHAK